MLLRYAVIPILDEDLNIVEKYKGTASGDKVFPMRSKCLINTHLKEIARICDVDKKLTFHTARHTFATEICLTHGVPIETVSRMFGHKDLIVIQVLRIGIFADQSEQSLHANSGIAPQNGLTIIKPASAYKRDYP